MPVEDNAAPIIDYKQSYLLLAMAAKQVILFKDTGF